MKNVLRRGATALAVAALALGTLATTAEAAPTGGDPNLTDVYVWATDVNVRSEPTSASPRLGVLSTTWLDAVCQKQGQFVNDPAVGSNSWWTAVMLFGGSDVGWVSNLYIQGGEKIAGVPDC
ncbi:hypothetical protein SZN_35792 [Streptomyces zinciresistens K42]|uniref:Peptidase M23 n=1 Tax=Streptomyces zinciresistens K42 TaxID=700597 RepID=G2GNQ3_9ACTN|nr:hypothetical protein [Streptomyces zinciresistens]EGX54863.1 hypothetical protein SZN_35792 [Streptomyces zinciresistens K42]